MTLVKWNPNRSLISDFDRIFDNMFNIDIPINPKENSKMERRMTSGLNGMRMVR